MTGPSSIVPHHMPPTDVRDASEICKYPSGHPSITYEQNLPTEKPSTVIYKLVEYASYMYIVYI